MSEFIVGIKEHFFIWNLKDGDWQAYLILYSLVFIYVLSTKNKKLIFLSLLGYIFSFIVLTIYAVTVIILMFAGWSDMDFTKDEDRNKNNSMVCIDGHWKNTFDAPLGGKMYFDEDGESHVIHKDIWGLYYDESGNRYDEIGPDMYSKE